MLRTSLLLALCSCTYQPGSYRDFRGEFAGPRSTIGCLDVAVALGSDRSADGVVLDYSIGNRCDRPVMVDLAAVTVMLDHTARSLAPYDPREELRALPIEARTTARESIEYQVPAAYAPTHAVCVDLTAIAEAPAGPPQRTCFESGRTAQVTP